MIKDYFNRNPIEIETTKTPKITQAIYYHKKLFFNRARLQVQWEEVPEADHYEIRVTKKNGESKIYKIPTRHCSCMRVPMILLQNV